MKITTKKPLRPRGRSDEKRQSTKDAIREVCANGPQMEVQIIPAKKDLATDQEQQKIRVCAYCRVSTEEDNQASSYELQVQNYTKMIRENPDWEFAGIFADATDIIGLKQNPTNGRRFSPIFFVYRACKVDAPSAVSFSKPEGEQKYQISISAAAVVDAIRKMANWAVEENWNIHGVYLADETALVYDVTTAYKPTPRGKYAKRQGEITSAPSEPLPAEDNLMEDDDD